MDLLLLPHDADGRPQGAIALLAERKQQDSSDLPFKLRTSATEDLLRSAWYMLEPHRRVFEQATLDRLSEVAPGGLSAVLECAAQLVKESTDADQVFLQYRQELIATPWHGDAPRGGGESSLTQLAKSDGAVSPIAGRAPHLRCQGERTGSPLRRSSVLEHGSRDAGGCGWPAERQS